MYDDFAMEPNNFEAMAKEYMAQSKSKILGNDFSKENNDKLKDRQSALFKNLEYLRVLVEDLKMRTKNEDILAVLAETSNDIVHETQKLNALLGATASAVADDSNQIKMFCNNLKLAIQTASEVVRLLIEIKDDDSISADIKPNLTQSIDAFLTINNKLVSLFGECRYLTFGIKK